MTASEEAMHTTSVQYARLYEKHTVQFCCEHVIIIPQLLKKSIPYHNLFNKTRGIFTIYLLFTPL